jgi:hypothetical protein
MQHVAPRQPFDGGEGLAVVHCHQRQAGIDSPTFHQHRAGAALAVVAAFFGTGQLQMLAQDIEQLGACIGLEGVAFSVHGQLRAQHVRRLQSKRKPPGPEKRRGACSQL